MKDYMTLLAGKLKSKASAIFGNTSPDEVTKPTKGGSVSSVSAPGVVSGKNQRGIAQGFVSSVSTQNLESSKSKGAVGFLLANLKNRSISPHTPTKLTKPVRQKVWRLVPYWPACVEATHAEGTQAAQQLYTALALHYGHTPEDVNARLDALVPHIHRRHVDSLIKSQWADAYIAAHPYAWELKLNPAELYRAEAA